MGVEGYIGLGGGALLLGALIAAYVYRSQRNAARDSESLAKRLLARSEMDVADEKARGAAEKAAHTEDVSRLERVVADKDRLTKELRDDLENLLATCGDASHAALVIGGHLDRMLAVPQAGRGPAPLGPAVPPKAAP